MSHAPQRIEPARIAFDARGTPYAEDFGDIYHSTDGGPAQASHVFVAGNDLPMRWRRRDRFAILETGFGLGLNFLCTAAAFLEDGERPGRLDYVAVEKHPPCLRDLTRAHAHWPETAPIADELQRRWPPLVGGFHRMELAGGRIALTLLFGEVAPILAELDPGRFDAIYLDGFAPEKNPQMWSEAVFEQIARLSRPGTTAATWSVAARVRAGLQHAGFGIERRAGFARKREMLCARRPSGDTTGPAHGERRAVIVGAGIAGCWTAYTLARRGWTIDLIERHAAPAQEASGNPVGALLPAINLADNENARLARAAFLYASRKLALDFPADDLFGPIGLLQLAMGPEQAQRMARIVATHGFPPEYVAWVEHAEAQRLAGHPVCGPGWWIPAGGWVQPRRLCEALLDAARSRLQTHYGVHVQRIARAGEQWQAIDGAGRLIAAAPTLVVANAYGAAGLSLSGLPRLISVRGQVSFLPPETCGRLQTVVCGDGYIAPLPGGGACVGSTFEPGSQALELRAEDHLHNLARAARMLPGYGAGAQPLSLNGRAALRTATADRLPACGELDAGLHLFTGLGARGLIWAPLCSEVLASRLNAEPNPVEGSLIGAVHPGRDAQPAD